VNVAWKTEANTRGGWGQILLEYQMKDEMARHVACMGGKRRACEVLVGEPERRRPLRGPRQRWVVFKWILKK
jgi:hypothetical protein